MNEDDRDPGTDEAVPLNREQRRAERFGHPEHERDNNPAFGTGGDSESYAGRPDQDIVRRSGAGAGGATESSDRPIGHEGQHRGNQPNS